MKVVSTVEEMRALARTAHVEGARIAFVPTMGAFHEGHLSLIRAARDSGDVVAISIFVNPLQFGEGEDLTAYPRDEQGDLELAEREGVDLAFVPSVEEMYATGRSTVISVGRLAEIVEGAHRPGHFDGVCTVVAKLFNIVEPDVALFGQKDAQQVAVLRRMVADLSLGVDLEVCPTVREPDGLALSSRNVYLSGEERARATVLFRALRAARDTLLGGGGVREAEERMWETLTSEKEVRPDYARVVDPETFEEATGEGRALLVVAARVGTTRLIDNLRMD